MRSHAVRHAPWSIGLIAACVGLAAPVIRAQDAPAPLRQLEARGAEVGESFKAPGGMTGYTIEMQGRTMTAYVLPGGEHALIGTLIDADGNNLSRAHLEEAQSEALGPATWSQLGESDWIRDGAPDAERVIYVFTDPNCPFCHRFWKSARPWVEAGRVQLRHIMVGILKPDSAPKSATLLAAENPVQALVEHERNYAEGGVSPATEIPDEADRAVRRNNALMKELGFRATPTVLYRRSDGEVGSKQGQPRGNELERIMGGPAPGS
ncbi:thiol:disulfide interchange protein DsbG [Halofilum ochraceum]|uniref:thiol:disulfide interchange protein DsbG n=1 Tax=Halofilum ochraceum TaxID=1611323 RepID=UPI0008363E56|nr:thiol:disulfide interchange protein DsbG [Halofilum ochraceum]